MDQSSSLPATQRSKPAGSLSKHASLGLAAILLVTTLATGITLYELYGIRSHASDALHSVLPSAQKRHRQAVDAVALFSAYHKLLHNNRLEEEGGHVGEDGPGDDHAQAVSTHLGHGADAESSVNATLKEIILRAASLQMMVGERHSEPLREVVRLSSQVADLSKQENRFAEMLHGYVEHGRMIAERATALIESLDASSKRAFEEAIFAMSERFDAPMMRHGSGDDHGALTAQLHTQSLISDTGSRILQVVNRMYRILLVAEHVESEADIRTASLEFEISGLEFYPLIQTLHESDVAPDVLDELQRLLDEFRGLAAMFVDQRRILTIIDEKHHASEQVEMQLDAVAKNLSLEANQNSERGIELIVQRSELTSLVMLAGVILIALCFVFLVVNGRRHLILPLSQASEALDALGMGKTDVSLPPMKLRELESIRTSLHRFRKSTLDLAEVNRRMEDEIQERRRREEEALYARQQTIAAIESMAEGFVLFDRNERIVLRNSQHRELFPLVADRIEIGMSFEEVLRMNAALGGYADIGNDPEPWIQQRLENFRNLRGIPAIKLYDGRWVRVAVYRTEDGGTVSTHTDITEHRLNEERLRYQSKLLVMLREIAYATSETVTLAQAIQICLQEVCNNTRFDSAHALVLHDGDVMQVDGAHRWYSRSGGTEPWFEEHRLDGEFDGLCGKLMERARAEDEPVWVRDLTELCNDDCECLTDGGECGLPFRSACAIPVMEHGKVVAYIELFASETLEVDRTLIDALVNLSTHLGRTTERHRSVMTLRKLRQAVEQSPTMILITDRDGRIEYANPEAANVTGYEIEELIGQTPRLFRSEHTDPKVHQKLWKTILGEKEWRGEFLNRRRNGEHYWASTSISPVRNELGRVTHFLGVAEDISERKKYAEQIEHLAHYDVLTDLPNRALFYAESNRLLATAKRNGTHAAMIMLDLDDFKDVNDSLGHATGDLLLTRVAARLQQSLRQGDIVARFGGDEFALLLADVTDPDMVAIAVQRMIVSIAHPYHIDEVDLFVNGSVGIAMYPQDGSDIEELLRHADLAMYRAKAVGHGTYNFFRQDMDREVSERKELESKMRQALENDDFEVYYQPQFDMKSRTLCGAEALLRWTHPERGPVSPVEFIPVAERCGLIVPLGEWVLRRVCRQARAWLDAGLPPIPIAVNLSPVQFKQANLFDTVRDILDETGLPPSSLHLEITEGVVMQDSEVNLKTIESLIALGIKIALDDFGTGYSSLSYLRKLPVSKIKIDRSFIVGVQENKVKERIVRTIAMLGDALNIRVNVEGIESELEYDALSNSHINEVQGFLFSRPITTVQFTEIQQRLKEQSLAPLIT